MIKDKFNITYGCGCVHEIEQEDMIFKPTGNDKPCGKTH